MPPKSPSAGRPIADSVTAAVAALRRLASKTTLAGMARFAITTEKALGVAADDIRSVAKSFGRSHDLAEGLWQTGWHEARILAAFVDEPDRVTSAQMDRWCRDFDNWAVCDGLCFHLFDKTRFAFAKVRLWANRKPEFEKRAAFALLASLAAHDKKAADAQFLEYLPLLDPAASDGRNFVKKGVSWAYRGIGHRSLKLNTKVRTIAERLTTSDDAVRRWVGKDVLRDITRPAVLKKLAKKAL